MASRRSGTSSAPRFALFGPRSRALVLALLVAGCGGDGVIDCEDDGSCQGAAAATYAFDIEPSSTCRDAIIHYVSDPCAGRVTTLNGMHVSKF